MQLALFSAASAALIFRFKGLEALPLITRVFETTEVKISPGTLEAAIKSAAEREALDVWLRILGHNE